MKERFIIKKREAALKEFKKRKTISDNLFQTSGLKKQLKQGMIKPFVSKPLGEKISFGLSVWI